MDKARHSDIFQRAELGQQIMELKDKSYDTVSECCNRTVAQRKRIDTTVRLVGEPTARRLVQGAEYMKERTFACAGSPHNADNLSFTECQVDTSQYLQFTRRSEKRFMQILNGNQSIH